MDNVTNIMKKTKVNTFFNHLNIVGPFMKLTVESPGNDGRIYFLDSKETSTPIINPETGLEIKKTLFISVPHIPGLCEELKRIFHYTSVQVMAKAKYPQMHTNASQGQRSIAS